MQHIVHMTAIIQNVSNAGYSEEMRNLSILLISVGITTAPVGAQHAGHTAYAPGPYAGFQLREAAGLSTEEAADLRAGRGMGLALPAELNGYPGPLHVLELADALGLEATQRTLMQEQIAVMRAETVPLGEALIAAEHTLDTLFVRTTAVGEDVDAANEAAALARGRLRAAHLRAHIVTRDALTETQRASYARLRGYAR